VERALRGSAKVHLELQNPRFPDREIKERLSEMILYARYAGIDLADLHRAIAQSTLTYGNEGPDLRYGGRLSLTTNHKTVLLIEQLVKMYPVFATWEIKEQTVLKSSVSGKQTTKLKETEMSTTDKTAKKKAPAKKAAAKKPAAKKSAAKKSAAKKPAAKKPAAKKKK
jgi:hypothetical protein